MIVMRAGDKLRFRGPNGARFTITVNRAWTPRAIQARIDSGQWTPLDGPPAADSHPEPLAEPPPTNAAKPHHVAYAVEVLGLDRAEIEAMTKMDIAERIRAERG